MKRIGICFGTLLLLPMTALTAEPVNWTYTSILTGENGSPAISAGPGGRPDADSPDGLRHFLGYSILTQANNAGPQKDSTRILLGSTPGYSSFIWLNESPSPGSPAAIDPYFVAAITIHDTSSGKSGTVSVTGKAQSSDCWLGLPADLNLPMSSYDWQIPVSSSNSLVLGQNRYTVKIGEVKDNERSELGLGLEWDQLRVLADVEVSPAQTPEPGTVVLAVIGLLSGLGWKWRESKLSSSDRTSKRFQSTILTT